MRDTILEHTDYRQFIGPKGLVLMVPMALAHEAVVTMLRQIADKLEAESKPGPPDA